MSSSKPQTRGLAALLRIEKERREREEAGADDSAAPAPEEGQEPSAPRPIPHRVQAAESEREVAPAAGEKPADAPPDASGRVGEESVATPAAELHPDVSLAAPETGDERPAASERAAAPVTSLPRPRPAPARPARSPRKTVASPSEPSLAADSGWEKFVDDWKPFLREGVKFKLCEFFYRNTAAVGRREFTTSTAQLSRVSGAHRRHIFLVLRQLEDLRFIRKEGVETNRKDEGLVIRFYPDRQA
ncbi:MAG: hypothetical protein ABW208_25670 [Pyrinomonadaceae bacterium]